MLTEDTIFLDYLLYAGWIFGIVLFLIGVFKAHLRILIYLGIVVAGGGVALVVSQKIPLQFEVVVLEEANSVISWQKTLSFTGGKYRFRDGSHAAITKPESAMIATVLINDTSRVIRVINVAYTATPNILDPGGRDEVIAIEPGNTGGVLSRIEHFGPQAEGPPASIKSVQSFDTINWVAWD